MKISLEIPKPPVGSIAIFRNANAMGMVYYKKADGSIAAAEFIQGIFRISPVTLTSAPLNYTGEKIETLQYQNNEFLFRLVSEQLIQRIIRGGGGSSAGITPAPTPTSFLKRLVYTIGTEDLAGQVDYTFAAPANKLQQSIQLGGTAIIPVFSPIVSIVLTTIQGLSGGAAFNTNLGLTSGSDEYLSNVSTADIDVSQETYSIGSEPASSIGYPNTSHSIYFSCTPSNNNGAPISNWSAYASVEWKIWIVYIDNSQ